MSTAQTLLFPDPKPLVERLGRDFFRNLPKQPGVYLMKDGAGKVLYVGKARSLRQRLGSYRVANPDRLPKRLLRLLRAVEIIDYERCADEGAALRREAELIREIKPRFNRAGVWPAPPRILIWRQVDKAFELAVVEQKLEGEWKQSDLLKGGAMVMLGSLVRVFWVLSCPEKGLMGMPAGWFHGRLPEVVALPHDGEGELEGWLEAFLAGVSEDDPVCVEVSSRLDISGQGWQAEVLREDWELLLQYFRKGKKRADASGF